MANVQNAKQINFLSLSFYIYRCFIFFSLRISKLQKHEWNGGIQNRIQHRESYTVRNSYATFVAATTDSATGTDAGFVSDVSDVSVFDIFWNPF